MANPSKNPGVDATQPVPGTDMTGVELDLLRELMRKAERNQLMAHANSLHNLEHKNLQDPKKAEWEAQQRSQWPMPGYAAAAKTTVQAPPQNSMPGRPPKTSDANYDPADDPSVTGIPESGKPPKADPPVLQLFGNVAQGVPPVNLPPAATAKTAQPIQLRHWAQKPTFLLRKLASLQGKRHLILPANCQFQSRVVL
eukprot:s851_g28.t1